MGHPNHQALAKTRNQTTGLEGKIKQEICHECKIAKSHRIVSRKPQRRYEDVGKCLHIDCVGPVTPTLVNGNNTILNIMDNASACRWAKFLNGKANVSRAVIEHIQFLKRQTLRNVKAIRFDGGTEFYKMVNYCLERGIRTETSIEYTPEQNGMAKRSIEVCGTKARTLIHGGQLPHKMWEEAYKAGVYLINRTST